MTSKRNPKADVQRALMLMDDEQHQALARMTEDDREQLLWVLGRVCSLKPADQARLLRLLQAQTAAVDSAFQASMTRILQQAPER